MRTASLHYRGQEEKHKTKKKHYARGGSKAFCGRKITPYLVIMREWYEVTCLQCLDAMDRRRWKKVAGGQKPCNGCERQTISVWVNPACNDQCPAYDQWCMETNQSEVIGNGVLGKR